MNHWEDVWVWSIKRLILNKESRNETNKMMSLCSKMMMWCLIWVEYCVSSSLSTQLTRHRFCSHDHFSHNFWRIFRILHFHLFYVFNQKRFSIESNTFDDIIRIFFDFNDCFVEIRHIVISFDSLNDLVTIHDLWENINTFEIFLLVTHLSIININERECDQCWLREQQLLCVAIEQRVSVETNFVVDTKDNASRIEMIANIEYVLIIDSMLWKEDDRIIEDDELSWLWRVNVNVAMIQSQYISIVFVKKFVLLILFTLLNIRCWSWEDNVSTLFNELLQLCAKVDISICVILKYNCREQSFTNHALSDVQMSTSNVYFVVFVKRFDKEIIQGRKTFIQNVVAMCIIDNVVRERVKKEEKSKDIELIDSLEKIEKKDSFELWLEVSTKQTTSIDIFTSRVKFRMRETSRDVKCLWWFLKSNTKLFEWVIR